MQKSYGIINQLFYGDNLVILRNREYFPNESVDLIYLDPPFNSHTSYNVLFKAPDGHESHAQMEAFEDTWHWNPTAEKAFDEVIQSGNSEASEMLRAMRQFLGPNDMLAYLVMMAVRLLELHRVLRKSGSLYLHCDPTASHYLKILLDAIFGKENFKNEIVWKRSHPKGHAFTRFATSHDVIFYYAKDARSTVWNQTYTPHDPVEVLKQYSLQDSDGRRYQLTSLLNPNPDRPNLTYEFLGTRKVWRWTKDRMQGEYDRGRIVVPRGGEGIPRYKRYLDEQEGIPIGDFWDDIEIAAGGERLGYPTQKPLALLERVLCASSNEGDVVLDPFCGCGTTVHAAQKLNRKWIGIDITHLAISLIQKRLKDAFPLVQIDVHGVPKDIGGARALAAQDKYQFQWWAVSLVDAVPFANKKKGADGGIDGLIYFKPDGKTTEKAIVSVKGGENVGVGMIKDLIATVEREKAKMGLMITLTEPTSVMRKEAVTSGYYRTDAQGDFAKIQIITIQELLNGKKPQTPWVSPDVFKRAKREMKGEQGKLL